MRISTFLIIFFGLCINLNASDFTWLNIATFDKQNNKTDLGGEISSWRENDKDKTQGCVFEYTDSSLKITYDVDSTTGKAANGIEIDLNMPDLRVGHYNLVFRIKGDKENGYTTRFKVRLETQDGSAAQIAEDITDEWKQINLPFSMFEGDIDWEKVTSLYIIFDSDAVTKKEGIIYIDAIFLN